MKITLQIDNFSLKKYLNEIYGDLSLEVGIDQTQEVTLDSLLGYHSAFGNEAYQKELKVKEKLKKSGLSDHKVNIRFSFFQKFKVLKIEPDEKP